MKNIFDFTLKQLEEEFISLGEKKYRAHQVFSAVMKRGAANFDIITELSAELRRKLSDIYSFFIPKILKKYVSANDGTIKYLFEFSDGNTAETVFMRYDGKNSSSNLKSLDKSAPSKQGWNSICLSTQCGCKMGCKFCASGMAGFVRNLTSGEILGQILAAEGDLLLKADSIVLMGVGEPLDNFDETVRFIRTVTDQKGRCQGPRHITVSTCGLSEKIRRLAELEIPVNLSVSLHAADNEKRNLIMPVNLKYDISELMSSAKYYFDKTHRRISFEYALIDGENDSFSMAQRLADLVRPVCSHVNLIPLNRIAEYDKRQSFRVRAFRDELNRLGITATIRRTLGSDINAACGQLRRDSDIKQLLS